MGRALPNSLRRAILSLSFAAFALAGSSGAAGAVDRSLGATVPRPNASGAAWTAAERDALARDLDAGLAAAPTLKNAHVGALAIDARDGSVLFARSADTALMPASTFKLLTGSAALDRLGPGFRFHTSAFLEGPIVGGVVRGRLVVRGGGDPLLTANDLDDLAGTLSRAGVSRIEGPVDVDTSHFADPPYMPGWSWDDFPYYYAPKISALSLEDNVVHVRIAPAESTGLPASVTAHPYGTLGEPAGGCAATSDVVIIPRITTGAAGSADTVDFLRDPGGCIIAAGSIPLGAAAETIDAAVPSPEAYVWHVLGDRLRAHHIAFPAPVLRAGFPQNVVGRPASVAAHLVWTHDSEPLSDLLADMWFPSDNLLAELLLKAIGAASREPGTAVSGIAYETQWLTSLGVDVSPLSIDDGSGLSAYDRITPRALVAILAHDWNGPMRNIVLDDLPVAGVRGTLASSFVGTLAEKAVFAKTGSVSHVRTIAGYAATQTHATVIFALQVGDWNGTPADIATVRASFLSRIIGVR